MKEVFTIYSFLMASVIVGLYLLFESIGIHVLEEAKPIEPTIQCYQLSHKDGITLYHRMRCPNDKTTGN